MAHGRGLTPGAKLVLWHLANFHNERWGCMPSQSALVDACEISRSTVNQHLLALETAGLIRRQRRVDPETHRQLHTRYIFPFEDEQT